MKNYDDFQVTMDSFGSECPANWEEIADYLNAIISDWCDELTTADEDGMNILDEETLTTRINDLWERYCAGEIEGAPEPRGPYNGAEEV